MDINKEYSTISEKEVFRVICGEDEYGQPKSDVSVKISDFDMTTEEEHVLNELVVDNAIVNVFKTPALTMVDLTFSSGTDPQLVALIDLLNLYTQDNINPDENILSTIVLTVTPKEDGDVFLSGIHGVFCLMPIALQGKIKINTVRFIFTNDYLYAFEIPDDAEE